MNKFVYVLSLSAVVISSIAIPSKDVFAEEMVIGAVEGSSVKIVETKEIKPENIIGQADGKTEIVIVEKNNGEIFTPNMEVRINGVLVDFKDQKPVIKNGRTLVPFRAILEAMGADIQWDEVNRTVRATKDGIGMVLEIGNTTALIGTEKMEMDVPAEIINGRTMVPLRFVSEGLGYEVLFDDANKDLYKIDINKSQEQLEKEKLEREKKNLEQRENIFEQFL